MWKATEVAADTSAVAFAAVYSLRLIPNERSCVYLIYVMRCMRAASGVMPVLLCVAL